MRRRHLLAALGTAASAGCAQTGRRRTPAFETASPAFEAGDTLPPRFTCDGAGVSPPFVIERVPDAAAALAIVGQFEFGAISDPVFWTLWNVPPDTDRIPADLPNDPTVATLDGASQGTRDGRVGYTPPCPPRGQRYRHWFQTYALSERLPVAPGEKHGDAVDVIESSALASQRLTVGYTRTTTRR